MTSTIFAACSTPVGSCLVYIDRFLLLPPRRKGRKGKERKGKEGEDKWRWMDNVGNLTLVAGAAAVSSNHITVLYDEGQLDFDPKGDYDDGLDFTMLTMLALTSVTLTMQCKIPWSPSQQRRRRSYGIRFTHDADKAEFPSYPPTSIHIILF